MGKSPTRKGNMATRALDLLTLSLADVAEGSGIPLDTLKSYKRATTHLPGPETAQRLGDFMRRRAAELVDAAALLEREAVGGAR